MLVGSKFDCGQHRETESTGETIAATRDATHYASSF